MKKYRGIVYILIFIFGILYIHNLTISPELKVKAISKLYMEDVAWNIYFDIGEGFPENPDYTVGTDKDTRFQIELFTDISPQFYEAQGIKIVIKSKERFLLRSLEIYNHGLQVKKYSINDIQQLFVFSPEYLCQMEEPYWIIDASEEAVTMTSTENFIQEFKEAQHIIAPIKQNIYFYFVLLIIIIALSDYFIHRLIYNKKSYGALLYQYKEKLKNAFKLLFRWFTQPEGMPRILLRYIIPGLLVFALLCVTIIVLKSKLYGHCDEHVTRFAIDYYMGKWLPPDSRSRWMAGTFSTMGNARLRESTWFYFIAGKLGWLISGLTHLTTYFRMLNLLMFVLLVTWVLRQKNRKPWMYLCIAINPQIWYLFSYATSDAWDLFWSFVVIYELAEDNSLLRKYIKGVTQERKLAVIQLIFSGLLFSFVFQAKDNYYVILLFSFIILFLELFEYGKGKVGIVIRRYISIVIMCLSFVGIKLLLKQVGVWIFEKSGEEKAANVIKADPLFQVYEGTSRRLRQQGVSFGEMMEKGPLRTLYASMTGTYGSMEYPSGGIYQMIYGIFVLLLLGILFWFLFSYGNKIRKIEILIVIMLWGLMVFMVLWHCWTGDYQPQGRYLLPCFLMIGYLGAKADKKIWSNWLFTLCIFCLTTLSLYSYIFVGMYHMLYKLY